MEFFRYIKVSLLAVLEWLKSTPKTVEIPNLNWLYKLARSKE